MKEIKTRKSFRSKKLIVARNDYKLKKLGYKGMPFTLKKHYGLINHK